MLTLLLQHSNNTAQLLRGVSFRAVTNISHASSQKALGLDKGSVYHPLEESLLSLPLTLFYLTGFNSVLVAFLLLC